MNERIRLLAGKALDQAVPETWTTLTAYDLNKFTEKFAELIVKECVNRVRSRQQFAVEDDHTAHHAFDLLVYDIESHFGVEE